MPRRQCPTPLAVVCNERPRFRYRRNLRLPTNPHGGHPSTHDGVGARDVSVPRQRDEPAGRSSGRPVAQVAASHISVSILMSHNDVTRGLMRSDGGVALAPPGGMSQRFAGARSVRAKSPPLVVLAREEGHRLGADRTAPWGVGRSVTSGSRGDTNRDSLPDGARSMYACAYCPQGPRCMCGWSAECP